MQIYVTFFIFSIILALVIFSTNTRRAVRRDVNGSVYKFITNIQNKPRGLKEIS